MTASRAISTRSSDSTTAKDMLLDELRRKRRQINDACHHFGGSRIRVFGSVARGEEQADSDIDFLVDLPRAYDLFAQRLPLQQKLSEITGRAIDLIPEHELSAYIRTSVLNEAVDL